MDTEINNKLVEMQARKMQERGWKPRWFAKDRDSQGGLINKLKVHEGVWRDVLTKGKKDDQKAVRYTDRNE